MSYFVHESSYIDGNVTIGDDTQIWHFCHVHRGAIIGSVCSLGQNVNIGNNAKIGNGVKIQNNVSVYEGVELEEYYEDGVIKKGVPQLTANLIEYVDLVIITTDHTNVDYEFVQKHAKFIFDTRNVMKNIKDRLNIELL